MADDERIAFLHKLDSKVWVEKRLFPARLLILDETESNHDSEQFVIDIIGNLHYTNKDNIYLGKGFAEVALMAAKQLRLTPDFIAENPICPFSTLEQFLSDLNVYGLREALAYLFESSPSQKFVPIEIIDSSRFL